MGAKEGAFRQGDGEGGEDVEDRVERVDALSGLRCDEGHTGWAWRVREREKGQTEERGGALQDFLRRLHRYSLVCLGSTGRNLTNEVASVTLRQSPATPRLHFRRPESYAIVGLARDSINE